MIKGVFRYGVAALLMLLTASVAAAASGSVNIEEHRESVAPLIEHGALVKTTKTPTAPTAQPVPTASRVPTAQPVPTAPRVPTAPTTPKVPAASTVPTITTTAKGALQRAVFAKQIVKREPVDEVTALSSDMQGVYFFTELEDMAGQTVSHRWEYDGQRVGYTEFKVTASHWRAWSYRKTPPGSTGIWKVKVLNAVGGVLGEKTLAPQATR